MESSTHQQQIHQKHSRAVNIIVYDGFPEKRAKYLADELKKVFSDVRIIKWNEKLPESAWYRPRNRWLAIAILDNMKAFTPDTAITLGFTVSDISIMKENGVNWGIMGLSYRPGKTVIISTYRLNRQKLNAQAIKLCFHELGHAEGLPHCVDPDCFMRAAEGKNHFDHLTGFCSHCKNHLQKRGWKI